MLCDEAPSRTGVTHGGDDSQTSDVARTMPGTYKREVCDAVSLDGQLRSAHGQRHVGAPVRERAKSPVRGRKNNK